MPSLVTSTRRLRDGNEQHHDGKHGSPLFALGLNFERAPDILLCRFSGIDADTNQIVQAVNRGNRSAVNCKTIIYGNPELGLRFQIPSPEAVKGEIATILRNESSLAGLLEQHFHIDRVAYRWLRGCERNSHVALSQLVEHDLIQNYVVELESDLPKPEKNRGLLFKNQKKVARAGYQQAIRERATSFSDYEDYLCFWKMEQLKREQQERS